MNNNLTTGPINLGNPHEITIGHLAHKINDYLDKPSEISYKDLPQDDPKRRQPDISKAKEFLNWLVLDSLICKLPASENLVR